MLNDKILPKLTEQEITELHHRQLVSRLMRLVAINAYNGFYNTVVGDPAPAVAAQNRRSKEEGLRSGDVVLECSTVYRWARHSDEAPADQYPGLGVLLRVVMEPIVSGDDLAKMHADGEYWDHRGETLADIPLERVVYIAPLDGTIPEYRWTNASFIRVLSSLDEMR
jgi:hypothetical protein